MKLDRKKKLAARTLNVGIDRIIFDNKRIDEIKEAITKQDIKDLFNSKAIRIKEKKGKRKIKRKKKRRTVGKVKKTCKNKKSKQEYVKLVRKLRGYVFELKKAKVINKNKEDELRKRIRAKEFRSKRHLKEILAQENK